ncbi:MAG: glycoside hydrolase family 27 protein [Lentisphaerae bacterium]|nr:MAG: glycoside hydrolase family 27 protein [Lentisphaerota bacterium]
MTKAQIKNPPLGWNSFDSYGCHIYEALCMKELEAMIEKFVPCGYEYFVIDNGWFSEQELLHVDGLKIPRVQHAEPEHVVIDEYGIVQPSNCFFPNGFRPLVDACKANGLKFGVHLMRGIPRIAVERNTPIKGTPYHAADIADINDTCSWCPYMYGIDMTKAGAQEYLNSVFEQFAQWGIEFVKVDDVSHRPAEIEGYINAVEKASAPICLSLSPGGNCNKRFLEIYRKTNMSRITKDIWDDQEDIDISFEAWKSWQGLETDDYYPDLDMIPFGELCILKREQNRGIAGKAAFSGKALHRICRFTEAQKETFITQRAMAASPLMIGGSMHSMDPHSIRLLTHPEMLACNQNGVMGRLVKNNRQDGMEIYVTPEKKKDKTGFQRYLGVDRGWLGLFNRTDQPNSVSLGQFQLGLKRNFDAEESDTYILWDIWRGGEIEIAPGAKLDTEIPPHGVAFYRFEKKV